MHTAWGLSGIAAVVSNLRNHRKWVPHPNQPLSHGEASAGLGDIGQNIGEIEGFPLTANSP